MIEQPEQFQASPVAGASPAGTTDAESASRAVREMFTSIAPRYDFLNHLLSLNIDRLWWNRTARAFRESVQRPGARVLDLCCGTGDMTRALVKVAGSTRPLILGADFTHEMLRRAHHKAAPPAVFWIEGDALKLPLRDSSIDVLTTAFGFRNLADYDAGLREIRRVLRPGGELGILDFGEPGGLFGMVYRMYFKHVLPRIGRLLSGVEGPYAYLPASVQRFPKPEQLVRRILQAGFSSASWEPYTLGIAGLYRAKK